MKSKNLPPLEVETAYLATDFERFEYSGAQLQPPGSKAILRLHLSNGTTIDLPTLPPPPKLPDIGKAFELIIPLIEKILQIWCLMKKSFAPVPEMSLNDQVTLLTNRPAYLIPLDILKLQLPNIALFDLGFNEVRIETAIYLGLRINIIAKPLDDASKTWNGWIQEIPDAMNQFYADYIIKMEEVVQEKLDAAEDAMAGAMQFLEDQWAEHVQGWLDEKVGDPLEEADAWARDQEAAWQEWVDKQESKIDFTYEEWNAGIQNAYDRVRRAKNAGINEFFDEHRDIIHGVNYMIPLAGIFEIANEENLGDELQNALDFVAEKLNEYTSLGPTVLQRLYSCIRYWGDCKENEQKYFEGIDDQGSAGNQAPQAPEQFAYQAPVISDEQRARELLATPQGQQMQNISKVLKCGQKNVTTPEDSVNFGEFCFFSYKSCKHFGDIFFPYKSCKNCFRSHQTHLKFQCRLGKFKSLDTV